MYELVLIAALALQQSSPSVSNVLSGQVSFFDGEAASNVIVLAVRAGEPVLTAKTTRTDADGIYRFENLPEGSYILQTVPAGPHTFYPGVATEADAIPVTITTRSVLENLNIRLTAETSGVRVRGRVDVPEGRMLPPNAVIRLVGGSPLQAREAAIAADGTFEARNVRPGEHVVTLRGDPAGASPAQITVGNSDVDGIEVVLPRQITIRGIVVRDSPGSPPPLNVIFARQDEAARVQTKSTTAGTFQVDLPAGSYDVTVAGLPDNEYIKSITSQSVDLQTEMLQLDETVEEKPLTITLGISGGVTVAGRVSVDGTTEENARRRLLAGNRVTGRRYETPIQDDGAFTLQEVMPGMYAAAVVVPGAISPPLFSLVIPQTGARDMEISVPGLVEISGRVAVEGGGPPPKFEFALVRASALAGLVEAAGRLPELTPLTASQLLRAGGGAQILQVSVNALPDGTFKFKVPAGEYRIATAGAGIPSAFVLKSINYGSARLIEEPMTVPASGPAEELQFGFGPSASNPWVSISGKITGIDAAASPLRVSLEGTVTSAIETPIGPDGSFTFSSALRDTTYTARIEPPIGAAPVPRLAVADQDITDVIIDVPRRRDVVIATAIEGGGAIPGFVLRLAGTTSVVQVTVTADHAGRFTASLPEDERRVQLTSLPFGYVLKSMTYGSSDLLKTPLRVFGTPAGTEVRVTLAADPEAPFTGVRGRISGLAADVRPPRLVLWPVAAIGSYETAITPDGTFDIPRIPQGIYTPALTDSEAAQSLTPALIVIGGTETAEVEFVAGGAPTRDHSIMPETRTGAVVTDLGGPTGVGRNEDAAAAALRTINTALITFMTSSGRYGNIADLIDAGLLTETFINEMRGYRFAVLAVGNQYVAAAIPDSIGGRYGFFSAPDAIIRYSTVDRLAPAGQNGAPIQ